MLVSILSQTFTDLLTYGIQIEYNVTKVSMIKLQKIFSDGIVYEMRYAQNKQTIRVVMHRINRP